ncbi:RNA polymerase sigma factor [Actinomycetospora chiangmaiensis]|uniref:RNA polymerase sigma factor n=1 Tax=Actinomycetospora chiangmaiensis TaxID=402650 RepID=UPI00037D1017|nr:sigma-70 family RNA polymerase sigma factor [Actinomycetospora chiangmaiensis]
MTGRTPQDDDFDAFVRRGHQDLQRRAWKVAIQNGTDPATLFSHALEVLWRKWPQIVPEDGVRLRFAAIVMVRKAHGERTSSWRRHEFPDDGSTALDREVPAGQWGADPASEVVRRERRLEFHRAVARLPEEEKRIMMYRTQEIGLEQIAREMATGIGTVRNGIARANRLLRKDLGLPPREDDDAR